MAEFWILTRFVLPQKSGAPSKDFYWLYFENPLYTNFSA